MVGSEARSDDFSDAYRDRLRPLVRQGCDPPAHSCTTYLVSRDGSTLVPVACWHNNALRRATLQDVIEPVVVAHGQSIWGEVLASGATVRCSTREMLAPRSDVDDEHRAYVARYAERYGDSTFDLFPLCVGTEVRGFVSFGYDVPDVSLRGPQRRAVERLCDCIALTIRETELEHAVDRGLAERRDTVRALEETSELLRACAELIPDGLALLDDQGVLLRCNEAMAQMLGRSRGELLGRNITELLYAGSGAALLRSLDVAPGPNHSISAEHLMVDHDGRPVAVHLSGGILPSARQSERRFVLHVTDLTPSARMAQETEGELQILDGIRWRRPLEETLTQVLQLLERRADGLLGSVVLVDEDGRRLRLAAYPSLPPDFVQGLEGLFMDPEIGSFGPVASLGRQVIVADFEQDYRWRDLRDLALGHGVRACWSTPVINADDDVDALVMLWSRETRTPSVEHQVAIDTAVELAGNAIEQGRNRSRLESREAQLRRLERAAGVVVEAVSDGVVEVDRTGRCTRVNPAAEGLLGWTAEALLGQSLEARIAHSLANGQPRPPERSTLHRALQDGAIHEVRGEVVWDATDRHRLVDYTIFPVVEDDEIAGAVIVLRGPSDPPSEATIAPLLTARERAVLQGLAAGKSGPEISEEMHVSPTTFQTHVRNAIAKLGANGRTHAVVLAAMRGEIRLG